MGKTLIRKVILNKRNNQLSINLPRKKIKFFKNGKSPKKIKIRIEDIEW